MVSNCRVHRALSVATQSGLWQTGKQCLTLQNDPLVNPDIEKYLIRKKYLIIGLAYSAFTSRIYQGHYFKLTFKQAVYHLRF